jgi:hypothetical protein
VRTCSPTAGWWPGFAYVTCVAADSRSTSTGVSFNLAADRICSSCSVVRALAIGATTCGWASNQASAARRDLVERLQYRRATIVEVSTGSLGVLGLHGLAARSVLAGQKALGQREVGQHGEVPGLGDGQQRALKVALDEIVVRLQDRELCKPMRALEIECRDEPLHCVVGGAEVADRARLDKRVECTQRLLQRRLLVVEVCVVKIDAVSLQALKRGMRLALDRVRP